MRGASREIKSWRRHWYRVPMTTLAAETDVKVNVYYLCFYLTMCLSLVGCHGKRYANQKLTTLHDITVEWKILESLCHARASNFKAAVNGTDKRDSIAAGLALYNVASGLAV